VKSDVLVIFIGVGPVARSRIVLLIARL